MSRPEHPHPTDPASPALGSPSVKRRARWRAKLPTANRPARRRDLASRHVPGVAWLLGHRRQSCRRMCPRWATCSGPAATARSVVGEALFLPLKVGAEQRVHRASRSCAHLDCGANFHGPWWLRPSWIRHRITSRTPDSTPRCGWRRRAGQLMTVYFQEVALIGRQVRRAVPHAAMRCAGIRCRRFHHTHWIGERTIANIEQCAESRIRPFWPVGQLLRPAPAPCRAQASGQPCMIPPTCSRALRGRVSAACRLHCLRTARSIPRWTDYAEPGGRAARPPPFAPLTRRSGRPGYRYGMMSLTTATRIGRILRFPDDAGLPTTRWSSSPDHGLFLASSWADCQGGVSLRGCCAHDRALPGRCRLARSPARCRAWSTTRRPSWPARHRRRASCRASVSFDVYGRAARTRLMRWSRTATTRPRSICAALHHRKRYKITPVYPATPRTRELVGLESDHRTAQPLGRSCLRCREERIQLLPVQAGNPAQINPGMPRRLKARKESDRQNGTRMRGLGGFALILSASIRPIRNPRSFLSVCLILKELFMRILYTDIDLLRR